MSLFMNSSSEVCLKCNGTGKIYNLEWDRLWEYYDNMGQFDMDTCCQKADEEADKYIDCTECSKTSA